MDNCAELCTSLHKIISASASAAHGKPRPAPSPSRPAPLQTTDMLGLDVEGMVLLSHP
jgi:hypothetical protein